MYVLMGELKKESSLNIQQDTHPLSDASISQCTDTFSDALHFPILHKAQ